MLFPGGHGLCKLGAGGELAPCVCTLKTRTRALRTRTHAPRVVLDASCLSVRRSASRSLRPSVTISKFFQFSENQPFSIN